MFAALRFITASSLMSMIVISVLFLLDNEAISTTACWVLSAPLLYLFIQKLTFLDAI